MTRRQALYIFAPFIVAWVTYVLSVADYTNVITLPHIMGAP